MQSLERNCYTKKEVKDVLHSKRGPRKLRFRYDLLDKDNQYIKTLNNVLAGEVSMNSLAEIKRTARFSLKDDGSIDFLNDRIQPFVELKMPEKREKITSISGDNSAINFDFSKDENGDDWPDNWDKYGTLPSSSIVKGRLGKALKITSSSTTGGFYQRNLNVNSNEVVYIKFVFKGEKPNYAYLMKTTGGNQSVTSAIKYTQIEMGWMLGEVEVIANETATVGFMFAYDSRDGIERSGIVSEIYYSKQDFTINHLKITPAQYIEFPLGIFLLSSPTRKDQTNGVFRDIDAYGGLLILRDDKFDQRYIIPAGAKYYDEIIKILQSAGITKYNIENTDAVLQRDIEFEPGNEKLFAINELLRQINYTPIFDDENGIFTSSYYRSPSVRAADYLYKDDDLSVTFQGMEEELDLFNIPNKWQVVCSNPEQEPLSSSYTNDNPESLTSTVNRGRTIVDHREVSDIASQASLDAYVQRIAFEASQVYGKLTFETAIMPMHDYADVLEIDYSPLSIKGKYA